eukprot:Lithocolla_globosa_v1_NODE_1714_length_2385_cov_6.393562.p4 type:complete len:120 gc:universal NODE_1714_length_2385_cov_6.393562:1251-1610(+)
MMGPPCWRLRRSLRNASSATGSGRGLSRVFVKLLEPNGEAKSFLFALSSPASIPTFSRPLATNLYNALCRCSLSLPSLRSRFSTALSLFSAQNMRIGSTARLSPTLICVKYFMGYILRC